MKRIVILTATRAEYGLLAPIIKKMSKEPEIDVRVAVTGAHLSPEFGMTVKEIIEDGINIDKQIDILLSSDTPVAISKTMGLALFGFAEYFAECMPDALMVLGDRYETLAVCISALNAHVPIIHLYGGEATEGLIDEAIRNSITKLSYLHFTSTKEYRNRVIQMGESPDRVYNVGAIGVENAINSELLTKEELEKSLNCSLGEKYAILTFHPVTLENNTAEEQIMELLFAIDHFSDITFICTKANADMDGRIINECIQKWAETHDNVYLFDSLGMRRYLSALLHAKFVIGNSSSGIIEVPSFYIPTINIGERQKGRIQAKSVINCAPKREDIIDAIEKSLSKDFYEKIKLEKNPYEGEHVSDTIVNVTKEYLLQNKLKLKKEFYNIEMGECR